ncbi:MAG: hypothetical protein V8T16_09325 [Parabacteroides merdae]
MTPEFILLKGEMQLLFSFMPSTGCSFIRTPSLNYAVPSCWHFWGVIALSADEYSGLGSREQGPVVEVIQMYSAILPETTG